MKKEKCKICHKMFTSNKMDNHHPDKLNYPQKTIRICKDCHFILHNGKKNKVKQVLKRGFVNIPKEVLFDDTITSSAKVLYAILVDKIDKKTFCFINNKEISSIMKITKTQTSRLFSMLEKYLIIKDRTMFKRKIRLVK